ncbi:MntP/YtaF family protein [Paenibacillus sp. TAF43_2]|uniref:MntP/YtaF family protein n=1 Tax=Paenibacillus sp. TAF43_2 TaxID=3233069 RepID=UPI003F9E39AA
MFAHVVSLLVLAVAVSVDGFGVGVTYGLRRIRIPIVSILIIACCSGIIIYLSMQVGGLITTFLSEFVARLIGACVLMLIGVWALLQLRRNKQQQDDVRHEHVETAVQESAATAEAGAKTHAGEIASAALVVMVELKRLGLVIQILRTPQSADVDKSGTISASEAVMLGFALSLDAFGAGLGAALIGLPSLLTALTIAAASALFLVGGIRFGFRFSAWKGMQTLAMLPGILLIIIGIMKLL